LFFHDGESGRRRDASQRRRSSMTMEHKIDVDALGLGLVVRR
jgi:hypothetical protein